MRGQHPIPPSQPVSAAAPPWPPPLSFLLVSTGPTQPHLNLCAFRILPSSHTPQAGCLTIPNATCIACNETSCTALECDAENVFDEDGYASNGCETGCPEIPFAVCGECSTADICTAFGSACARTLSGMDATSFRHEPHDEPSSERARACRAHQNQDSNQGLQGEIHRLRGSNKDIGLYHP